MTERQVSVANRGDLIVRGKQQLGVEAWAARINDAIGASAQSVIDLGHALCEAKDALPHGEWSLLFKKNLIPLSIGSVQRFMKIAEHPVLSNTAHAPLLPSSWYTLYELTKLPEAEVEQALTDGRVTPELTRAEVKRLVPHPHTEPDPKPIVWDYPAACDRLSAAVNVEFSRYGAMDTDRSVIAKYLRQLANWTDDADPS